MQGVLVLPSPLLPARAYEGLAGAFERMGLEASVAPAALAAGEGADVIVDRWSELADGEVLLVPHSNAGYLAPLVRAGVESSQPIVFMDAALPPRSGRTALAPSAHRDRLTDLADEGGVLPPWTRWWPRTDLEEVIPPTMFDDLDRDCPRLPLGYFDEQVTAPPAWTEQANAYLAFGDTYTEALTFAGDHGWPSRQTSGGHLHFLHNPDGVADQVVALADEATQT